MLEEESRQRGEANVRREVEKPRVVRLVETRVSGEGWEGGEEMCVCVRACMRARMYQYKVSACV